MSTPIVLILIFSFIGIINTIYLSYHSFTKTPVKCLFFPQEWCLKVQQSKWSKTFGIPNTYAGLTIYFLIFILTLLGINGFPMMVEFVKGLIYFGFAFSMYFVFIQAFILKAFCTWCVVSAVDFVILLITILMFNF